jgi:hypothetical protein
MSEVQFRKSSYSGGAQGNCVEVANVDGLFAVRDSKDHNGPALTGLSAADWTAFLASLKSA